MAVVYRATDVRLNRTVAIKVLPPDLAFNADVRTRFIREAQTAAQLSHPNIVPIYAVDDKDGGSLVYFVMAFVDGESLGVRISREGAWPVERTVRVLRDVADALAYAHASGHQARQHSHRSRERTADGHRLRHRARGGG